jgi:hypothetical protein
MITMNCSRSGTALSIDIRLALLSLGRNPYDTTQNGMTVAEKQSYLAELRAEQRKVGGILKEGA